MLYNETTIARLRAHAQATVDYEEAGAKKDGRTPDHTWEDWQRGKDTVALIDRLEKFRAVLATELRDGDVDEEGPYLDGIQAAIDWFDTIVKDI